MINYMHPLKRYITCLSCLLVSLIWANQLLAYSTQTTKVSTKVYSNQRELFLRLEKDLKQGKNTLII